MLFTWIDIFLLSSLTSDRFEVIHSKNHAGCVFITSLKIAIDSIQLPLMYSDYPFVVCGNHN